MQHGFFPERSTDTQLLECVNKWIKNHNEGCPTDLDYDEVPHQRLLYKLELLGVRGKLLEWLKVPLTNRILGVRSDRILSAEHDIASGVVQGSLIDLLIF